MQISLGIPFYSEINPGRFSTSYFDLTLETVPLRVIVFHQIDHAYILRTPHGSGPLKHHFNPPTTFQHPHSLLLYLFMPVS